MSVNAKEILQMLHELKQKLEECWEASLKHEREDIERFEIIQRRLDKIEKLLENLKNH